MKRFLVVMIICLLFVGVGSATKIDLNTGITTSNGNEVNLTGDDVSFTHIKTGMSVKSSIMVDGVKFDKLRAQKENEKIKKDKDADTDVNITYEYDGRQLKETIILKKDKSLSFPIVLDERSKLIPWDHGTWKIVSAIDTWNTMDGIIVEKPFGIDANGNRIEMEYQYNNGKLDLVYNRTITQYTFGIDPINGKLIDIPIYSEITYPLIIDPTWTLVTGYARWESTNGEKQIVMWNQSGTNNWTVPEYVTSIELLVIGAGGGGGGGHYASGGGAGGLVYNASYTVTQAASIPIIIGAKGVSQAGGTRTGTNGGDTTFDAITGEGGGGGVREAEYGVAGGSGGGGAIYAGRTGGSSTQPTTGLSKGYGYAGGTVATNYYGAGGGGSSHIGYNGGSSEWGAGGNGTAYSITGESVIYAAGGGGNEDGNAGNNGGSFGVGGDGGYPSNPGIHPDGALNTGSGGGAGYFDGSYHAGGDGDNGLIILSYQQLPITITASFDSRNYTSSISTNTTSRGWEGVAPFSVQFTNTSTNPPHASWVWNYTTTQDPLVNVTFNQTTYYNPIYTFNAAGNYSIKLNVTGTYGSNVSIQNTWVNVSSGAPVSSFTSVNSTGSIALNSTSRGWEGYAPFNLTFTDTTTFKPTGWNWSRNNLTVTAWSVFNTSQTAYGSFVAGNWSVNLTTVNQYGVNVSAQTIWVNVTSPSATSYTVTPTWSGFPLNASVYGMNVSFSNSTTNIPVTSVYWEFGDTYTSTSWNPKHWYSVAGRYNVNVSFTNSTNTVWSNRTQYVNLSSDNDGNVRSWLHYNGTDGGNVFTGEEGLAWTPTSATTSITPVKFGYSSGAFLSDSSKISTPSNSVLNFGAGNFTIEQWVYPTGTYSSDDYIVSRTSSPGSNGWGLYGTSPSLWYFYMGTTANNTAAFALTSTAWNHVVIQRVNGVVYVYVNGVYQTSKSMPGPYDVSTPLIYGDAGIGTARSLKGYIDESRISTTERWNVGTSSFSTPYAQYVGDLLSTDVNLGSTFRFKTNPGINGAIISNQTPRFRTVQIQNVNITNNITGVVVFNPTHLFVSGVTANATTYSGINFTSVSIDNSVGTVSFSATRPSGFSTIGQTDNRASFMDMRTVYWNYTQPGGQGTSNWEYFGSGFLKNQTNGITYPVYNFISTNVTYLDWDTFPEFTADKSIMFAGETVTVTSTSTGFPNIYNWSWGDGTWTNGTNSAPSHTYNLVGDAVPVTLYGKLWQNMSVSNSSTHVGTVRNPVCSTFVQSTAFITDSPNRVFVNSGNSIWYNSTSKNASHYIWNFYEDDGSLIISYGNSVTTADSNLSFSWSTFGNKTVELVASMAANTSISDTETKVNFTTVEGIVADFHASATTGIPGAFITFTDDSILSNTTGVSYNWSFGDGYYSDSTGATVGHIYSASGIYTVSLIVCNYGGCDPETKSDYIIISSNSQQSTWYSPLQVDYQVVNKYGEPLPGMWVDARFYADTFPDKPWLTTIYGMPDTVTSQMEDNNLIMAGATTDDGSIVFTQHSSLQYKVNISGLGYTPMNLTIQPADNKYTIWMDSPVINNSVTQVNATLTFYQPDINHATLGVKYQDPSGYTTLLEFVIKSRVNGTIVYQTSVVPGTSPVWLNETIDNIRGESWRWYYNAVRLV